MRGISKNLWLGLVLVITFSANVSLGAKRKSKTKTAEVMHVTISHCHDGDTCTGWIDPQKPKEKTKIRFAGIDAPEAKQPFGAQAKAALESKIKTQKVRLECMGQSYDRKTCLVFLNELEINRWLVQEGWAWDSPKYSKAKYTQDQSQAQAAKKGIWKDKPAASPYCFRNKTAKACRISQTFNP